jgi:hypothetical protein
MNNDKPFLELEVIWKDDYMIELKITASNGVFCGATRVYDSPDSLTGFAKSLSDFPTNNSIAMYELGGKDSYAYFSMKFYCLDTAGHTGLRIDMEENTSPDQPTEKDKVSLQIPVELNAVDDFQKRLLQLAIKKDGKVMLQGSSNTIQAPQFIPVALSAC